jgi:hypothetical protein
VATHALIVGDFEFSVNIFQRLGTEFKEIESLETAARLAQGMGDDRKAQLIWNFCLP